MTKHFSGETGSLTQLDNVTPTRTTQDTKIRASQLSFLRDRSAQANHLLIYILTSAAGVVRDEWMKYLRDLTEVETCPLIWIWNSTFHGLLNLPRCRPKKTPGPKGDFWKTPTIAILAPPKISKEKKTAQPTKRSNNNYGAKCFPKGAKNVWVLFFDGNIFFPNQLTNRWESLVVSEWHMISWWRPFRRLIEPLLQLQRTWLRRASSNEASRCQQENVEVRHGVVFTARGPAVTHNLVGIIMIWWYKVSDSKRVSTCSICSSCYIYSKYTDYIFYVFCI